ncbi:BspA family leucine-rich repeat surface protein [Xylocopilactobacillus apicola]|uniref:Mub B2-like domain-containing protein n=1 Tax=Xylocopilactobacillus apicola TaxID=2932184 RepID=A0AAU9DFA6_9LACO|nr:BspA family leucine-rich repeat surface protein [Xylocopilactobacillus apicola]BDR59612.1 hypothetical protein XA3_20530 [Xylocopilactobacillus apicola]
MKKDRSRLVILSAPLILGCGLGLASQEVKADSSVDSLNSVQKSASTLGTRSETIINSGVWGTSKWEYVQSNGQYILRFHAGKLGTGGIRNIGFSTDYNKLNKIQFDPGVVAASDSSSLFAELRQLTQIEGLNNLNTSKVTNMSNMFARCYSLNNLDLSSFDTSRVTDMSSMFIGCYWLSSLDLRSFDTSRVVDMSNMFKAMNYLHSLNISRFNTSNVQNMSGMFYGCGGVVNLDVSSFDTSKVTDMSYMFYGCGNIYQTTIDLKNFNTSKVTDMSYMFSHCSYLTDLNLNSFDTSNVTNMISMFYNCTRLRNLDITSFDTSKVTNMSGLFAICSSLVNLNLKNLNTSKVTNMGSMFAMCSSLTELDLRNFSTSEVRVMESMFNGCSNLSKIDVSSFDTSNSGNMASMFSKCSSLKELNLSNFDTSRVVTTGEMFGNCTNLESLDIRNFTINGRAQMFNYSVFFKVNKLKHLVLGSSFIFVGYDPSQYPSKQLSVPEPGAKIPGTDRVVASSNWVATSGYQQGTKYSAKEMMTLYRNQVTTYEWDSKPDDSIETKEVTRTINLHYADDSLKSIKQTAKVQRLVTTNADGSKTYGEWSKAQWDQYDVPKVLGCAATQDSVPAQTVDGEISDSTVDIYYDYVEQTVMVQYVSGNEVVGTQKYMGYLDDVITPRYRVPRGYEIIGTPPTTITVDGSENQVITINVKLKNS